MNAIRRLSASQGYQRYVRLAGMVFIFCLPFSFWPRFDFGMSSGINLKLSLAVVAGILFVLLSVPQIIDKLPSAARSIGVRIFLGLAVLYSLGLAWTGNLIRGFWEAGFFWFLFGLFVAIYAGYLAGVYSTKYRQTLVRVGLTSVAVTCLFAVWQLLAESFGVGPEWTLLPEAYRSGVFGFARPTGFMLEPEFLANLLIIPSIWLSYRLLKGVNSRIETWLLILVLSVVFMTISRGAIYSLLIAVVLLLVLMRSTTMRYLAFGGVMLVALVFASGVVAVSAGVNTRDQIGATDAVAGATHQMSMGVIDWRQPVPQKSARSNDSRHTRPGYVEESTTSRLSMSDRAFAMWLATPRAVIAGVGTGGFGAELHSSSSKKYPVDSIVNNQYISMAAEHGLLGFALLILLVGLPVSALWRARQPLLLTILLGLLIQWLFFSGFINVIHTWVILAIAYVYIEQNIFKNRGDYDR